MTAMTNPEEGFGLTPSESFDVVIYEIETRRVVAVIGEAMRRHDGTGSERNTAEYRQQTGRLRVNDRFDVAIVPAGRYAEGGTLSEIDVEEGG